ncbi:YqcC family protein [Paraglaciecola sp.]|uniref:YqcC family protein n=1 Tax=Paraglaciecola sp. TaxID=1920173 RepID=UPI0030F489A7
MPRSQIEVETLLQKLETVLRDLSLWSVNVPSLEAMASTAPFACDSMPLEQWLQFIFIPKIREWLLLEQPLPNQMGLFPMGQQCFTAPAHQHTILVVLLQIDRLFEE